MFLLDTDTCIWVLRGRPDVSARLQAESPDDVVIASITEAELRYGCLASRDPAASLARVSAFLSAPLTVLPFDRDAAVIHAQLRYALRKQPIGERDLMIASVAGAGGWTVVTSNTREFERVPGLKVVSWA